MLMAAPAAPRWTGPTPQGSGPSRPGEVLERRMLRCGQLCRGGLTVKSIERPRERREVPARATQAAEVTEPARPCNRGAWLVMDESLLC